jgi:two-component system, OmpR family, response regulator RegX3
VGANETGVLVSRSVTSTSIRRSESFVIEGPVRVVPGGGTAPEGLGRILVVQSDADDCEGLRACLSEEGYRVEVALDGAEALRQLRSFRPHLVLLDFELPDVTGTELCRHMRDISSVPVIVVAALSTEDAIVVGLEAGAADYVIKPYQDPELVARIQAVLRRVFPPVFMGLTAVRAPGHSVIVAGPVRLDSSRRIVTVRGRMVPMSRKEFDLLWLLIVPPGRVRTREELIDMLWGGSHLLNTRTVDTHIRRLRLKIEDDASEPRFLVTVRGVGFRFDADAVDGSRQDLQRTSLVS